VPQVFLRFGPPIARVITDTLSARGLQGGTAALATVPVALQSFDPATLSRFRGFTSWPLVQPLGQPSAQPTLAALLMCAPLPQSSFSSRAAAASDNGTEVVAARLRLRRNAAVDAVFIERPQHAAGLWTELSQTHLYFKMISAAIFLNADLAAITQRIHSLCHLRCRSKMSATMTASPIWWNLDIHGLPHIMSNVLEQRCGRETKLESAYRRVLGRLQT
jgi:hypothetical protein